MNDKGVADLVKAAEQVLADWNTHPMERDHSLGSSMSALGKAIAQFAVKSDV